MRLTFHPFFPCLPPTRSPNLPPPETPWERTQLQVKKPYRAAHLHVPLFTNEIPRPREARGLSNSHSSLETEPSVWTGNTMSLSPSHPSCQRAEIPWVLLKQWFLTRAGIPPSREDWATSVIFLVVVRLGGVGLLLAFSGRGKRYC